MYKTLFLVLFLVPAFCRAQVDVTLAAESVRGDAAAWGLRQIGEDQEAAAAYVSLAIEQQVAQNAVSLGLTERMDVNRALHQARRQVLVQAMREEITRRVPPPTEEEVAGVYQARPNTFMEPEAYELTVYQWGTNAVEHLDAARTLLAGDYSEDALEPLQGSVLLSTNDTGVVTVGMIVPEIWAKLSGMKDGEAGWFTTESGQLWVRRKAFREARLPPLEEVRDRIRAMLFRQRGEAAWREYIEGIQAGLR